MERNMPTSAALGPQLNPPLEPARGAAGSRMLPLAGALVVSVGFGWLRRCLAATSRSA